MKQNKISFLTAIMAAGMLLCQSAGATVLRNCGFVGYTTGNLGVSGTGTSDLWENATPNVTVTNGSGSLDGTGLGLLVSSGDKVFISATASLSARDVFTTTGQFPTTVDTNLYYSFLYRFNVGTDVTNTGQIIMRLNRLNSGTTTAQHWDLHAKNVGGNIQIGISKAGGNITNYAAVNIAVGQTFFVVVKQHIIPGAANDVYDLYINPPAGSFGADEGSLPASNAEVGTVTTDGTEDTSNTGPGRLVVASGANANLDELRIATTWAEVTPPLGQCLPAGIMVDPTNVTQVAEIQATFSVTASGTSPSYQWQSAPSGSSTFTDISGATASSFTTTNLQLATDNGKQYRAVVNVACGPTKATSAVATVTLTAPVRTPVGLVIDDFFADQIRDNAPVTTNNSVWHTSDASGNLDAFSGSMIATPITGKSSLLVGDFVDESVVTNPVDLAVGRSLKVTLPFMTGSFNAFTTNSSLRFGLYDYADSALGYPTVDTFTGGGSGGNGVGTRGYMLSLDFGKVFTANSPLSLLVRSVLGDINLEGSTGDFTSLGSGPSGGGFTNVGNTMAFQANTTYTLVMTVTRTALNSVDFSASIAGLRSTNLVFTATETNFAYHRFDAIAIRDNALENAPDTITFPELKAEVLQSVIVVPRFNITAAQLLTPTSFKLTWDSISGANYQVQSSAALGASASWGTNTTITATSASTSFTDTSATGNAKFYRVVSVPSP